MMPESHVEVEYQALRDTIRERGSLRVLVFVLGLAAWAAAWAWLASSSFLPAIALIPLLLLSGTFEAIFALHMGVERIGRYLEVFHEGPGMAAGQGAARWETTMTEFSRRFGGGIDPLFSGVFATATLLNLLPVAMLRPRTAEWLFFGVVHLGAIARLLRARRLAAEQRNGDLAAFLAIHRARMPSSSTVPEFRGFDVPGSPVQKEPEPGTQEPGTQEPGT